MSAPRLPARVGPRSWLRTSNGGRTFAVDPRPPNYQAPKGVVVLKPNAPARPAFNDVIVKLGIDGLTPEQARKKIFDAQQTPLAEQNRPLLNEMADAAFHQFNVVFANTFLANSPDQQLIRGLQQRVHPNAQLYLLGTLRSTEHVVYRAVHPGTGVATYYARDAFNNYAQVDAPRYVVMEARFRLDPPGLVMKYPNWAHSALSGPTGTITEL